MTRLFTDGAEMGDLLAFTTSNDVSCAITNPRSGIYSYAFVGQYASAGMPTPNKSELYIRIPIYIDYITESAPLVVWKNNLTTLGGLYLFNATKLIGISVTSDGATHVAVGSIPLTDDTWHLLEVHIKIADSGGMVELKIDGILDSTGTYTGDTKPGAETTIDNLYFRTSEYGDDIYYIDDIAINDTAGAVDNSWCGDGHVIALTPNANGDSSQLLGNDANSTDNYLLVDEVPSDGNSTYVESATAGAKDLYNLTACGLTDVNILKVWAEARAKDTTTGAGTVKLLVKTESTEYASADIDLTTSYAKQQGAVYAVNPNTSAAWTTAQLDALQVGMKIVD